LGLTADVYICSRLPRPEPPQPCWGLPRDPVTGWVSCTALSNSTTFSRWPRPEPALGSVEHGDVVPSDRLTGALAHRLEEGQCPVVVGQGYVEVFRAQCTPSMLLTVLACPARSLTASRSAMPGRSKRGRRRGPPCQMLHADVVAGGDIPGRRPHRLRRRHVRRSARTGLIPLEGRWSPWPRYLEAARPSPATGPSGTSPMDVVKFLQHDCAASKTPGSPRPRARTQQPAPRVPLHESAPPGTPPAPHDAIAHHHTAGRRSRAT
jgi:hypothetical protein